MKTQECEIKVRFIKFKEADKTKWCHAKIENETENSIEFRTMAAGELIEKKKEDILKTTEKQMFSEENTWKMYRGEILDANEVERVE